MNHDSKKCRNKERGYVLLVLLLAVAVLSIGFTAVIQGINFEIKRDREEELIHRGVQYSRAVRRFIKAVGRYPNRVEELERTNNVRFLRKRYKDPISGRDFKILHLSDLPSFKPIAGSASATGLAMEQVGFSRAISAADKDAGDNEAGARAELQSSQSNDASVAVPANQTVTDGADAAIHSQTPAPLISPSGDGQKFSKGPMVGVASISKTTTIREFSHKNHYNEWQFVYDPSTDLGGLLTTPNQPVLQKAVQPDDGQSNAGSFNALGGDSAQGNRADGAQLESPSPQQH